MVLALETTSKARPYWLTPAKKGLMAYETALLMLLSCAPFLRGLYRLGVALR